MMNVKICPYFEITLSEVFDLVVFGSGKVTMVSMFDRTLDPASDLKPDSDNIYGIVDKPENEWAIKFVDELRKKEAKWK